MKPDLSRDIKRDKIMSDILTMIGILFFGIVLITVIYYAGFQDGYTAKGHTLESNMDIYIPKNKIWINQNYSRIPKDSIYINI